MQLTIDEFRERSEANLEWAKESDNIADARELFQESFDQDAIADAFEEQRAVEETRDIQEKDVSRLEKSKKWAKDNMLALSGVAITIAGLVTTIIVGTRSAVVQGANGVKNFLKAVKNAIGKIAPWATGLANLAYNIIVAGAKGAMWLAQNLWVVVMFLTYLLLKAKKYV